MVSSAIWDVAYFSFKAKSDLHIFRVCYLRNVEHLKKSSMVVRGCSLMQQIIPPIQSSLLGNLA